METRDHIRQELREIAPVVAEVEKVNVYAIHPTYFDRSAEEIISKIKAGKEPVYYLTKQLPYTVPQGYFDILADNILQHIKALETNDVHEELEHIAPLLNNISKKPVYTIPEGYFTDAVAVKPEASTAKVISMRSKAFRYVAAAAITGLIAVGTFFATMREAGTQPPSNPSARINELSEQEIEGFLKTTSYTGDISSTAIKASVIEGDIDESVKDMSDEEIKQFLQENGEI